MKVFKLGPKEFKALLKEQAVTKNGVTIKLVGGLSKSKEPAYDKFTDIIMDLQYPEPKSDGKSIDLPYDDMNKDLEYRRRMGYGGHAYGGYSSTYGKPAEETWGKYDKADKEKVYQGSPFAQESYDSLPSLEAKDFTDRVANEKGFVLVKYSAKWCEACKDLEPITRKMNMEIKQRFYVMDVGGGNDSDNKKFAKAIPLTVIPTVILYSDGKEVDRVEGYDEEVVEHLKSITTALNAGREVEGASASTPSSTPGTPDAPKFEQQPSQLPERDDLWGMYS